MRGITATSSSSSKRGRSRFRGCYSTATNPRVGVTTRCLARRAQEGSWARLGGLVGKHKRAQSGRGFGVVPSSLGGGFSIALWVVQKELCLRRCRTLSCPSQLWVVSYLCVFPKRWGPTGRLTVCISINNRSIIQIHVLHPDISFLLPRVIAKRVRCFAHRQYLGVLDPCLDSIRGVWV